MKDGGDNEKTRSKMTQSGDGYVECMEGHTHWGIYGAAGILLRRDGSEFYGSDDYLLVKRRPSFEQGIYESVWGIPGGALNKDEDPYEGALRELNEEMRIGNIRFNRVLHVNDHGGWTYTTFLADYDEDMSRIALNSEEHLDIHRFTSYSIGYMIDNPDSGLSIHPGLVETWNLCYDELHNK